MSYKPVVRSILETAAIKADNAKKVHAILSTIVRASDSIIRDTKADTNPQMVALRLKVQERRDVADAVLQALNGDFTDLNSYR